MSRRKARDQYRGEYESHYDSLAPFDKYKNIMCACLKTLLDDCIGSSPYYRKEAILYLQSEEGLSLASELGCEEEIVKFLQDNNLVIPLIYYTNATESERIPLFLGREGSELQLWNDDIFPLFHKDLTEVSAWKVKSVIAR